MQNPLRQFLLENSLTFKTFDDYRWALDIVEDFTTLITGTPWANDAFFRNGDKVPLVTVHFDNGTIGQHGYITTSGRRVFLISMPLVEKAIEHIAHRLGVRIKFLTNRKLFSERYTASVFCFAQSSMAVGKASHTMLTVALMEATIIAVKEFLAKQREREETLENKITSFSPFVPAFLPTPNQKAPA